MLDVFEKIYRNIPFNGLPWFFDHAETITSKNFERVPALDGGTDAARVSSYNTSLHWIVSRKPQAQWR